MMCIAQHDLFQVIPGLEADIRPPPFQEAVERLYKRNAWIGPAGEHPLCSARCCAARPESLQGLLAPFCRAAPPMTVADHLLVLYMQAARHHCTATPTGMRFARCASARNPALPCGF